MPLRLLVSGGAPICGTLERGITRQERIRVPKETDSPKTQPRCTLVIEIGAPY